MTSNKYLSLITAKKIGLSDIGNLLPPALGLSTQNLLYSQQIVRAHSRLKKHFEVERNRFKPLNCLILGPPGSGKSTVAKNLTKSMPNDVWLREYNLSQFGSVTDISHMFDEITQANSLKSLSPGVVLIDEFDVRIGGVSAIQALISPIYDRRDFRNIAFIFSGSYLKSRKTLGTQLDRALEFDLRHCLAVYRIFCQRPEDRKLLAELDEIFWRIEQKEVQDPDQSVLNYLASLEKLIDFRSRINGFVIEIPDLDSPLDVTTDPFRLSMREPERLEPSMGIGELVREYVISLEEHSREKGEKPPRWTRIDQPLLQFKDMLLVERLGCVIRMIRDMWGSEVSTVDRHTLNFLTTVPVRHGMRSVGYLISQCKEENHRLYVEEGTPGAYMLQLHTRNVREFRSPLGAWQRLQEANSPQDQLWERLSPSISIG